MTRFLWKDSTMLISTRFTSLHPVSSSQPAISSSALSSQSSNSHPRWSRVIEVKKRLRDGYYDQQHCIEKCLDAILADVLMEDPPPILHWASAKNRVILHSHKSSIA